MWFVFVAVGLVLVIAGGLYTRRRLTSALGELGAGNRAIRSARWIVAWLLFGYPLAIVVAIAASLALGRDSIPFLDGRYTGRLLGIPFAWAVLVALQAIPWLVAIDLAHGVAKRRGVVRAPRWRALAVLAVLGSFAIYTTARIAIERGEVRIRHHQVGQASGAAPFRIAFVADVQQDDFTTAERARELYAIVNASQPDLVLSAGDWINSGPDHIEAAAATAGTLQSRLGTFSVRGDHENFAYIDRERSLREIEAALRAQRVAMISNEVRWFEHAGKRIGVVFLEYNYIRRASHETVVALLASIAAADYRIVVSHQVDAGLAALLQDRADLVLSGHTHGGQINPVLGVTHVNLARLETALVDGRYQRGRTTFIVTAGVGYSIIPLRYAAPGSIELIELAL